MNTSKQTITLSPYIGVYWDNYKQKYKASIMKDGKAHFLGYYFYETEAALQYNEKAVELFGPYAKLNVIDLDNIV